MFSTDLDLQVNDRDVSGNEWRTTATAIMKMPRDSAAAVGASSFPQVRYEEKVFEWEFGANAEGFRYAIRSKMPGKLCFVFDQAHLLSNIQSKEIPMRVYFVRQGPAQKPTLLIRGKAGEQRTFDAPPLCFAQQNLEPFALAVDLSELFSNSNMINIR